MSAREEALQAAYKIDQQRAYLEAKAHVPHQDPLPIAVNAASDVWEPLLRDCVEQMKAIVVFQSTQQGIEWHAALYRAIEALES